MKTTDVLLLGGVALGAWWLYQQQQRTASIAIQWPMRATSAGVGLPSRGLPLVNAENWIAPGASAPTNAPVIAPELWTEGGSPSGGGGFVGFAPIADSYMWELL